MKYVAVDPLEVAQLTLTTLQSIILVHGLGGHPRRTWEGSRGTGGKDAGEAPPSKRRKYESKLSSSTSTSTSIAASSTSENGSTRLFWPEEYLAQDIPEARVWTYGYNADTINGLFQANNKNTCRSMAVTLPRN